MTVAAAFPHLARLHFAAFASIFCVGVWATSFGPALPFLADDMGMSLGAAGLLLTALFCGSILASGAIFVRLHVSTTQLDAAGLAMAAADSCPGARRALERRPCGGGAPGRWGRLIVAAVHGIMATTSTTCLTP
jgi:hypothetical protein